MPGDVHSVERSCTATGGATCTASGVIVAFLPLTLWLLVKGVDVAKWRELAAR